MCLPSTILLTLRIANPSYAQKYWHFSDHMNFILTSSSGALYKSQGRYTAKKELQVSGSWLSILQYCHTELIYVYLVCLLLFHLLPFVYSSFLSFILSVQYLYSYYAVWLNYSTHAKYKNLLQAWLSPLILIDCTMKMPLCCKYWTVVCKLVFKYWFVG